jgi:heme exporter protein C
MYPQRRRRIVSLLALGLILLAAGAYAGLVVAPPERMMGDVYRIMFVHVPAAWLALVAYTVTFVASLGFLLHGRRSWDAAAHASAELGVLFNAILLVTGAIWGRPTWGVWWSWDPRLTTAAIMLFAFVGYLALRRLVEDAQQRAVWAAVVALIVYADIPIVWFSVRWWNSLHQLQSSPATVAAPMVLALRINAFAFLFLYFGLWAWRYELARLVQRRELADPPGEAENTPATVANAAGAP